MGAKERKQSIKEGNNFIATIQKNNSEQMDQLTVADLEQLASDLSQTASAIVEDFEEQRENLADRENLLNKWEEDHGYQSEEWETVVSDLDDYAVTTHEDGAFDVEEEVDKITQLWQQGPQ